MGRIIGLSGVDGSGKTTVATSVVKQLKDKGYTVTYHHEIDFIFLKPLFRFVSKTVGRHQAENVKENLIIGAENGSRIWADMYYILVWLDSLLAYIYFKLKKGVIIHDRWIYDFTTFFDHKYYRNRLIKKLYTIFPSPDVYILLTVPEDVALKRKEGDIAHIDHDINYYKSMASKALENAKKWECDAIIDASRPIQDVTDDIFTIITN